MKLCITLFAAFACTTAVTAVSTASNPLVAFGNFEDFWLNIKCIYTVLDKVMDGSNVDDLWHDLRVKLTAIAGVESGNCLKIVDSVEQKKCKIVVIEHGVHALTKFLSELVMDHKLDLDWNRLRFDIAAECFAKNTTIG